MRVTLNLNDAETVAFTRARSFGLLASISDAGVARAFMMRGLEASVSSGETVGQGALPLHVVTDSLSESASEPFVSSPLPFDIPPPNPGRYRTAAKTARSRRAKAINNARTSKRRAEKRSAK
jgi:hypothetical protein